MSSIKSPTFTAGGLASGLDTNSIIDGLVTAESAPLAFLKSQASGLTSQISVLGDLSSKLSAMNTAIQGLKTSGVRTLSVTSSNLGFTATTDSNATASRSSIQVDQLAQAAKLRSQAYDSASAPVTGGTYTLGIQGVSTPLTVADGTTLSDLATQINASGLSVVASVTTDGSKFYLALTNQDTGFPVGGDATQALTLSTSLTGSQGTAPTTTVVSPAKNAMLTVDGLPVERTTNDISDVLTGTTLSLKAKTLVPEDLVLVDDPTGTASKLQTFVDSYNTVMMAIQKQLNVTDSTDRGAGLAGESSLRTLQQNLQSMISHVVPGTGNVRTLADVGVKTNRDGTLTLDSAVLGKALARDPSAFNTLVNSSTDGLAKTSGVLNENYTNATSGLFVTRTAGLNKSITQITAQEDAYQTRLDNLRTMLTNQFAAMETLVSSLKSTGNYLTSLANAQSSK